MVIFFSLVLLRVSELVEIWRQKCTTHSCQECSVVAVCLSTATTLAANGQLATNEVSWKLWVVHFGRQIRSSSQTHSNNKSLAAAIGGAFVPPNS